MLRCLCLLCATIILLSQAATVQAEDRALVIGINAYPNITRGGQPGAGELSGAVPDAQGFAAFLVKVAGFKPEQVKVLLDGNAKKADIEREFDEWLVRGTKPGERAIFYFAGHGAQVKDQNGDEPEGDLFDEAIAPSDAAGELDKGPIELTNLIIDDQLGDMLKRLADRSLMVVVDSCHSGTVTRSIDAKFSSGGPVKTRSLTPRSPALTRGFLDLSDDVRATHKVSTRLIEVEPIDKTVTFKAPVIWTATASSQLALDLATGGVFTQSFLSGVLEGKADANRDGKVTANEMLNFVKAVSEKACAENKGICTSGLTPTLESPAEYLLSVLAPHGSPPFKDTGKADQATELFTHANDFAVKVEMLPSTTPAHGSAVKFRASTSEPGTLILLDQSPDGGFYQIFPNKFAKAEGRLGHIRANITIPDPYYGFDFKASDKGKGTLIALVVEDAAQVEDILSKELELNAIKDAGKVLSELARRLQKPVETKKDEPNRRMRWGFATLDYEVK